MSTLPNAYTEPVRRNLYVAAIIVALATILGVLGVADDWTPQVLATAGSLGLGEFALIAFGVERARDKVWSPATADEHIDAEHVIHDVPPAETNHAPGPGDA